jgi:MoaA/NifB/PqqE/SkfB family radical SAM enzyme
MLKWDHWHIELSSICALKCPRCPRAEVPDTLLNRQLSLNFFEQNIGASIVKQIKKITFCGNDGDPIYCRDFLKIIRWLKQVNPDICLVLVTNGSYKTAEWWQDLGKIFTQQDEIQWSIDGWSNESNQQYRINSDWTSIIDGINEFNKVNDSTYKTWASIGFKFNELNIDNIKILAKELNFDQFQLTKSTKFGSKYPVAYGNSDTLEPKNKKLISSGFRFEREIFPISDRKNPNTELKKIFLSRAEHLKTTPHSGICLIGNKGVFLNSQGEFYPCCWTATRYEHNSNWQMLASTKFNLHNRSFTDCIEDEFWSTDFLKFDSLECTTKCTRVRLQDTSHSAEW